MVGEGGVPLGRLRGRGWLHVHETRTDLTVAGTGVWHTFHALKRSVLLISVGYTVPLCVCGGGGEGSS